MYKYDRIADELEEGIKNGVYREGERLPSVRELCRTHSCNKSTAIQALRELESRRLAYSVRRSGHYVLKKSFQSSRVPRGEFDFATASPDWNAFPYEEFQHCIRKAMDLYQRDLFGYGTERGLPALLKAAKRQLENHQVFVKEEQLIVTSGVQEALFILMSIPVPNGKETILVEQPGYHLMIECLNQTGKKAAGIERTAQGIDLARLEELFRQGDIKYFCTMPRFHNPLGTSYTKQEKLAILKLAEKYDVYIVEDDYLADYDRDSKADPIFSYDTNDRVIYLKSYSKIMFPGLRIGVAAVPAALMHAFQRYRSYIHIDSPMISQGALEIYIQSGMFEHHRNNIQAPYLRRAQELNDAVRKMGESNPQLVRLAGPTYCMHTHFELAPGANAERLIENARLRGVAIETAKTNYLAGFPKRNIIKLNVSMIEAERIGEGIGKLTEALAGV